ncbi:MAG: lysophospholipid acyltransferase family protein [Candidatus Hydrogenedentota bacterium]
MKLPGIAYDSPYTFTHKQRLALRLQPPLVAAALKGLILTCRFEQRETHRLREFQERGVLCAVWHETMAMAACQFRGTNYHTLTSFSYDGELAARIVRCMGLNAVRGSSSRGGGAGLRNLQQAFEQVKVAGFTLDGPRGPRRVAKPGLSILSGRTQAPILPLAYAINRAWRLHSWDRFPIPKPFSHIVGVVGAPISPPPDDGFEVVENHRVLVQNALNTLHKELEDEINPDAPPFDYETTNSG